MRRGVTMLEILVAAIVLSVGLIAALQVFIASTAATGRAGDHAKAMIFARSKLEEVLKEPILTVGEDRGQGVDETTNYDWFVSIEETQTPSLVRVAVRAENRQTHVSAVIAALRRPDLQNAPDPAAVGTGASTPAAASGGTGL